MRKLLAAGTLLLASTLVGLVLAEITVRMVAPQRLHYSAQEAVDGVMLLRASRSGVNASPGEYDTLVTVGPQRFRGARDVPRTAPPETTRIVAMGDSFTFSIGANDDEAYPRRLEAHLRDRGRERVEVINAGIPASALGQQIFWWQRGVKPFAPDVVVQVLGANDLVDERRQSFFTLSADGEAVPRPTSELSARIGRSDQLRRALRSLPGYELLTQRSHLVGLVRKYLSMALREVERDRGRPAPVFDDPDGFERELDLVAAQLRWYAGQLAAAGTRLVVVHLPPRPSIYPELVLPDFPASTGVAKHLARRLANQAASAGYAFLDLEAALAARAGELPRLFFDRDPHLTAHGYDVMAAAIAAFLVEQGIE